LKTYNPRGYHRFLLILVKTLTFASSGWYRDAQSWLNHWGIEEEIIMGPRIMLKILLPPMLTTSCGMIRS